MNVHGEGEGGTYRPVITVDTDRYLIIASISSTTALFQDGRRLIAIELVTIISSQACSQVCYSCRLRAVLSPSDIEGVKT